MNAAELIHQLNHTDELNWVEAKKGSAIDRSILETVCAFSNEPGMGGGHILLGVVMDSDSLFPAYTAIGIQNPDKLQLDLASQCASVFNQSIRPQISVEQVSGHNVLNIFVPELPEGQKPVYFKNEGLPRGAYRRIGSGDLRCTDDDLHVFYNVEDTLDSSILRHTSMDDVSEEAVALYRKLRAKVNAFAEELQYNDLDLLHALGCTKKEKDEVKLTYAGLLLFGKRAAHRRLLPMVRLDYIRVPGNEWVEDPENRFTTIDMRGPLLELVQRAFSQISDDLPKGFLLPEGELQAESIGLPGRVLREAIVNALIHRSYRVSQPIQIIRYKNRLEMINPGFSLKSEEHLGEPGSVNRNPHIAAVFHETNLAETKGSGIRTMRSLMSKAGLLPPTFESDHAKNEFTTRLLLHHFLGEDDIEWLAGFNHFELNKDQKLSLIFVKEVGAIDNSTYRQLNSLDIMKASVDLRDLRKKNILNQKGKGKATYYVPGEMFILPLESLSAGNESRNTSVDGLSTPPQELSTPPQNLSTPPQDLSTPAPEKDLAAVDLSATVIISADLQVRIDELKQRVHDSEKIREIILEICENNFLKASQIATIFNKGEDYLKRKYLSPMIAENLLVYLHPEMLNHPDQAYRSAKQNNDETPI